MSLYLLRLHAVYAAATPDAAARRAEALQAEIERVRREVRRRKARAA